MIVQHRAVAHGGELLGQRVQGVIALRCVGAVPVSYTHLDVYKRQGMDGLAGLAHLMVGGHPAGVHHGAGRAHHAAHELSLIHI